MFGLGRLDEALSAFGKASGLNPSYTNAWFGKGEALMQLGRHQDAVVCFENVVKLNPADVEGWFGKANAFGALGLYRETLACFLEAEKLGNPNAAKGIEQCRRLLAPDAELYFITGSDYQQKGNNVDAIACYEKGLAINPNKVVIWVNKGAALLALKRGAEAVVCFDRAIALDPRAASAWNNKGCALLSLGQQSEGWACLQEAKRLRT